MRTALVVIGVLVAVLAVVGILLLAFIWVIGWLTPKIRDRYQGRLMPWYLRWAMPLERPMLMLVGRRGKGKTAIAAKIGLARMRSGERVYANFDLWDERRGMVAGRVYSLLQCLDLEECTVIVDEANQWCNAREWSKIPADVLARWQMSRKRKVSWIFTTQHESRVELVIRQLVDFVLVCERIPLIPRWVPLFRCQRTFLEEIEQVRSGKLSRPEYYWLGDDVLGGYDTDEEVDASMLANIKEYRAALEAGEDAATAVLRVPERREPVFSGGTPPRAARCPETPREGGAGATAAAPDAPPPAASVPEGFGG